MDEQDTTSSQPAVRVNYHAPRAERVLTAADLSAQSCTRGSPTDPPRRTHVAPPPHRTTTALVGENAAERHCLENGPGDGFPQRT
jgi:hypothetical protein